MSSTHQKRNTWIFIGSLLLAGIANILSRPLSPEFASLMTVINYVLITGLLLFWIQSVRIRLLPSSARTGVLGAAFLMLLYMLLRIFRYRFAVEPGVMRYVIYAYWIPQMLIPTLFLMTCIRLRHAEQTLTKGCEVLLLIPAFLLSITVLTNDLHLLVYSPRIDLTGFVVDSGTYTYGPVFYLLYVWMILTFAVGLILLFREAGHVSAGAVRALVVVAGLWFGYILFTNYYLNHHTAYRLFNVPETHTFGMLGIFEVCIRYRLIPYNENYSGFFRALHFPAMITDQALQPVYNTRIGLSVGQADLRDSLTAPVALPEDRMLHGKKIGAGYAFWLEDESGIRRAQDRLQEANETIEQENELIRAENEQKERDAYLRSRHRIYHEIAEELYPVQKRITNLLDNAEPGTEGFKETIAKVSALNAYVKRKTNLLLLASEEDHLSIGELRLALQESANYLTIAGLKTTASLPEDETLPAERIITLYDAFECIAEQLMGRAPSLMVSWNGGGLCLAAETDQVPDTQGIALPVSFRSSEDILYMDIRTGKEAAE